MYLSGHIEAADSLNTGLIKEGVALYKAEREHIHNSFPFWPIGFTRINDSKTWASVGLASENNNRVLLAVWRLDSDEKYCELQIYRWAGKRAKVRQIYPKKNYMCKFDYDKNRGVLLVCFPKTYQARFFEITEY